MSMLEAALLYASWGWPVFPCKPNKAPYIRKGFKAASIDPEALQGWWRQWSHASIAVQCGPASGIWVVDLDVKDGKIGVVEWQLLQAKYGVIHTAQITTPSGGLHVYFVWTDAMDSKVVNGQINGSAAMDTRTAGGYCILPPSQTPQGQYVEGADDGFEQDIVEAPPWLMGLLEEKKSGKPHPPPMAAPLPRLETTGLSPAEAFNARFSWEEILIPYGWVCSKSSETKTTWKRPGGNRDGAYVLNERVFYVHTTSTEDFEAHKGYSKFGAYAVLRHGGDRRAAARHLMGRKD